jgi:hypothetical protein
METEFNEFFCAHCTFNWHYSAVLWVAKDGAAVLCDACGNWNIIARNRCGSMRKPIKAELRGIRSDPKFTEMSKRWRIEAAKRSRTKRRDSSRDVV